MTTDDTPDFTLMTPRDLSQFLKVTEKQLREWRKTGKGPKFIKFGIQIVYISSSVQEWVREQEREQATAIQPK